MDVLLNSIKNAFELDVHGPVDFLLPLLACLLFTLPTSISPFAPLSPSISHTASSSHHHRPVPQTGNFTPSPPQFHHPQSRYIFSPSRTISPSTSPAHLPPLSIPSYSTSCISVSTAAMPLPISLPLHVRSHDQTNSSSATFSQYTSQSRPVTPICCLNRAVPPPLHHLTLTAP